VHVHHSNLPGIAACDQMYPRSNMVAKRRLDGYIGRRSTNI